MPDDIKLTINGVEHVPVPVDLLREVREDVAEYWSYINADYTNDDERKQKHLVEIQGRVDALDALLPAPSAEVKTIPVTLTNIGRRKPKHDPDPCI